jgi:CheY-like chemotaxis protein
VVAGLGDIVSGQRILIIDDYAPAAQAIARLLRLGGHAVITAGTSEEAISLSRSLRPDIVLLDINLRGAHDGFAVARWIRAEPALEDVLLVAITGHCDATVVERLIAAGFDHYLLKPIAFADLESIIPRVDETARDSPPADQQRPDRATGNDAPEPR